MIVLDFNEIKDEIVGKLDVRNQIVLASCYNQRVTARTVYYVNNGLDIYFLTSKAYLKYKQIEKNSNVALCLENLQIEGQAVVIPEPSICSDDTIISKIHMFQEMSYFLKYKNTVLIKVNVTQVEMWKANKRVNLDLEKGECCMR